MYIFSSHMPWSGPICKFLLCFWFKVNWQNLCNMPLFSCLQRLKLYDQFFSVYDIPLRIFPHFRMCYKTWTKKINPYTLKQMQVDLLSIYAPDWEIFVKLFQLTHCQSGSNDMNRTECFIDKNCTKFIVIRKSRREKSRPFSLRVT